MLVDILSSNDYIVINKRLIKIVGIEVCIYLQYLIDIYSKAIRKNKLENNFVTIDRNYIYNETGIEESIQRTIDIKLEKAKFIIVDSENINKLFIDLDMIHHILVYGNMKECDLINRKTKITKVKSAESKTTKKEKIIEAFKNSISCQNQELSDALKSWIDGVYSNPKGFLSLKSIQIFQKTLDEYCNGDLDLALKIVEIATVNGQRDCNWAIDSYEKYHKTNFRRKYPKQSSDAVELGDEVF